MKRLLMGLAVLPFIAGVAGAAQPLTNQQMDRVTAGFSANSEADAFGIAIPGSVVLTATDSVAAVKEAVKANVSPEFSITAYTSFSKSGSTSASVSIYP
ncbi:MAG: hypothetical protein JO122_07540 [Acetobacteraceae bacterium]|nr:hypothetical protein [Acetobacteraceae bacterium]